VKWDLLVVCVIKERRPQMRQGAPQQKSPAEAGLQPRASARGFDLTSVAQ
jgi:hypothetical protein